MKINRISSIVTPQFSAIKKLTVFLIILVLSLALAACGDGAGEGSGGSGGTTDDDDGFIFSGDGSSTKPFLIASASDLIKLSELINASEAPYAGAGIYYRLSANITMTGAFAPIGAEANPFCGSFDGAGHTISNLNINTIIEYTGLFGYVDGGDIANLGLVSAAVTGGSNDPFGGGVGGIAGGLKDGSITGCYVTGTITGSGVSGGIAGLIDSDSTIRNCYTTCSVSVRASPGGYQRFFGGIVGINSGTVRYCYATGRITGQGDCGGIAGQNLGGTVSRCIALNPEINKYTSLTQIDDCYGRVVGDDFSGDGLTYNAAWEGMGTNTDAVFLGGTAENVNGEGWDKIEINKADSYSSYCPLPLWTRQDGSLPGLFGGTVEIPSYID